MDPKDSRKEKRSALMALYSIKTELFFVGVAFLYRTRKFYRVKKVYKVGFVEMEFFRVLREPQTMVPNVPEKAI